MEEGNCRLCGHFGQLSFEHVPPRKTYNKTTRYTIVPFLDLVKDDNYNKKVKGKIEQGGIGFYSLCINCNNFLGINYVNAYDQFVRTIAFVASRNDFNHFVFDILDLEVLKILKQIISMFLSINDYKFSTSNPELVKFVRDSSYNLLTDRYRVFSYINTEGQLRCKLPLF